jgi:alkylated DNA repair dioxygenase AlkB
MSIAQHHAFISRDFSRELFDAASTMGLERRDVRVFGRTVAMPRDTAWCCDGGTGYTYSGQTTPASPWPESFLTLREQIEEKTGRRFPCCLVNRYADGRDSVAWHRDDEGMFGADMLVACVSLGATRIMRTREEGHHSRQMVLADGGLALFGASVEHTIPKTKRDVGARISLTFRTMDT